MYADADCTVEERYTALVFTSGVQGTPTVHLWHLAGGDQATHSSTENQASWWYTKHYAHSEMKKTCFQNWAHESIKTVDGHSETCLKIIFRWHRMKRKWQEDHETSYALSLSLSLPPPPPRSTEWQRWHSIVEKTSSWKRAAAAACAHLFTQIPPL